MTPVTPMTLLVVRHAKAKSRLRWEADDRDRPLTKVGRAQSKGLARLLAPYEPRVIVSSPYVRCIQTIEPLATKLGMTVDTANELAEGDPDLALEMLCKLDYERIVACTHGDVVLEVLDALRADGLQLPADPMWAKGSTWVLERSAGSFVGASYLEPPSSSRS